jgi:hypothetical protein
VNATSSSSASASHRTDADRENAQVMQSLGHHHSRPSTHMNLLEILNHIQMGSHLHGGDMGDELYLTD